MRSAAGGFRWESSVTRTPSASWLRLTVVAATDIVSVCGKLSSKSCLTSSSCPSPSVTCRQDFEVEQDRASSVLVHLDQLARQAAAQLSHYRSVDRGDDDGN